MDFNYFLTSFLPSKAYGGKRLYDDMVEQAVLADQLGFRAVSIPEHHLVNILLVPAPLQMAVKIARSEEHTSELHSLMRISYAVFCLKKKKTTLLIVTQT